jgi:MinD superfamily P-loop ATPase
MKNNNYSLKDKVMDINQLENVSGGNQVVTGVKYKINKEECVFIQRVERSMTEPCIVCRRACKKSAIIGGVCPEIEPQLCDGCGNCARTGCEAIEKVV